MNKEKKNLLVFGYGLVLILSFFCWRTWHEHGWTWINCALSTGAIFFLIITPVNRPLLKKIYDKWMIVAHGIGNVISSIILALLFYGFFSLVGIVARIMKKDFLDQKIDPDKDSYWIKTESVKFDKETYKKQF